MGDIGLSLCLPCFMEVFMDKSVSVYINVRENGEFSISVDVPLDLINKIQKKELSTEDIEVEELAKRWLNEDVQPTEKTI